MRHAPRGSSKDRQARSRPRRLGRYMVRQTLTNHLSTTLVLCGYGLAGSIPGWYAAAVFAAALAVDALLLFALSSRSMFSSRQPSLKALQVLSACALNLFAMGLAPQIGCLFIFLLFAPLCHSSLCLDRRSFVGTSLAVITALIGVLAFNGFQIGIIADRPSEKVVFILSLSLAMGRFMAIKAKASGLQAAMYDRNRELVRTSNHFAHLASHDDLTGLPNRREALRVLEIESERADRCGTALCVAMLDADHFKQVNDRYGHEVGDAVLKALARVLDMRVRSVDHVFRFGGEEFLLLLVDHADGDALRPLERVREAVARHEWERLAPGLEVTVSIGMTQRAPGEEPARVLRRADAALYKAKTDGRNRLRLL